MVTLMETCPHIQHLFRLLWYRQKDMYNLIIARCPGPGATKQIQIITMFDVRDGDVAVEIQFGFCQTSPLSTTIQ